MRAKAIRKDDLPTFLEGLRTRYRVFGPVVKDGLTRFAPIQTGFSLSWDLQTKFSSKDILFPRCETLFAYSLGGRDVELREVKTNLPTSVIFGVPPCEGRSYTILDSAFLSGDFTDVYYNGRRQSTLMVGIACTMPWDTCFCTSVGGDPFGTEGLDLLLKDIGDRYVIEVCTERGKALLEGSVVRDAEESEVDQAREVAKRAHSLIGMHLDLDDVPRKLEKMFDDPLWNTVYAKCVGCGICTFLCPTCYCFDIIDEGRGSKGRRARIWDSCQYPLFTLQGSGHNPRPSGKERMRQRIMHKFNYFAKNFRQIACVGCGRCVRECPVNLDIREILKRVVMS